MPASEELGLDEDETAAASAEMPDQCMREQALSAAMLCLQHEESVTVDRLLCEASRIYRWVKGINHYN